MTARTAAQRFIDREGQRLLAVLARYGYGPRFASALSIFYLRRYAFFLIRRRT